MSIRHNKYLQRIDNLGLGNFLAYTWHQKTKLPKRGEFTLASRHAAHPLICRGGTSDIDVFKHIYVICEYACLNALREPRLILDCGANGGFSTAYLLHRFPSARVVAVEPDPGNFALLLKNTAPFGERCKPVRAGVWSKSCGLVFAEEPFGDGREWARRVREAGPQEVPAVAAVDVATLLLESGCERIALLKIDIEGSEAAVFDGSHVAWLDRVDNVIIELHGEECTRLYHAAVDAAGFESRTVGGLTLSRRPSPHA